MGTTTTSINYVAGRSLTSPLQRVAKVGLQGGLAALLIALVGMLESFNNRFIISELLTTGQALIAGVVILTGYLGARHSEGESSKSFLYGLLSGLIVGGMMALLVLLNEGLDLRDIFANASPRLFKILTFDQEATIGALLLTVIGGLLGLVGGALYALPGHLRSALATGIMAVILIGLLQELLKLFLNRELYRFLFASKGLNLVGTSLIFILFFLARLGVLLQGDRVRAWYEAQPASTRRSLRFVGYALALAFVLYFPHLFGKFPSEIMNNVALLGILMGLGLNIVVGFAGLLDLGYVGFFAIGAYTMAVLTSPQLGFFSFTFWQALPFAILISVLAGIILGIPVLNMRGDYLAIVTLGFGEIIRLLVLSDALRPFVGGAQGVVGIPNPVVFGRALNSPDLLYYLLVAATALAWFISIRLRDSRLGRAWMAMREDEDVAEAMGINLVTTKLLAFGTGASMAGLGGAIFASKLQSIAPLSFDLLISVNALSVIIIGGLASVPGVLVGALLLIGLPELLREFAEYRLWVYGALLVVMMINRPEGFWPEAHRRRELHESENPDQPEQATVPSNLTEPSGP